MMIQIKKYCITNGKKYHRPDEKSFASVVGDIKKAKLYETEGHAYSILRILQKNAVSYSGIKTLKFNLYQVKPVELKIEL